MRTALFGLLTAAGLALSTGSANAQVYIGPTYNPYLGLGTTSYYYSTPYYYNTPYVTTVAPYRSGYYGTPYYGSGWYGRSYYPYSNSYYRAGYYNGYRNWWSRGWRW